MSSVQFARYSCETVTLHVICTVHENDGQVWTSALTHFLGPVQLTSFFPAAVVRADEWMHGPSHKHRVQCHVVSALICGCTRVRVCMCVHMRTCGVWGVWGARGRMYKVCEHVCVCMSCVYTCVCVYVCVCGCECPSVCMCMFVYVCMHVRVCIYIYVLYVRDMAHVWTCMHMRIQCTSLMTVLQNKYAC